MTFDLAVEKAAEQVPNLVVLALIVSLFLKHLRLTNAALKEVNKENLSAREESRAVIKENTAAVAKNTEVLHSISKLMKVGTP